MTVQQRTHLEYKQIRRILSRLYEHIEQSTLESDSRQETCGFEMTDFTGIKTLCRLCDLFDFDFNEVQDRVARVILSTLTVMPGAEELCSTLLPREITNWDDHVRNSLVRVNQNVCSIVNLLYTFHHDIVPIDLGRLWRKLLFLDLGNEMEDYLKFQTASYLAKMMCQADYASMPPSKKFTLEFPFVGMMNKFLRARLFSRDLHFGWSMCQMKRGMAPLRGASVVANLFSHKTLLSARRSTPPQVLFEVQRTVNELMEELDPQYEFKLTRPSPAACHEFSRQSQGCQSAICGRKWLEREEKDIQVTSYALLSKPHTIEYTIDGSTDAIVERIWPCVDQWYDEDKEDYFFEFETTPIPESLYLHEFTETDPCQIFNDIECRLHANTEAIPATVVALSEPFKTRIITKSGADANYYAKPLQQAMHKTLRRNKIFTALDRPLLLEDFGDIVGIKLQNDDWMIVSGDYSAATDNINSDATITALWSVMERLNLAPSTRIALAKAVAGQEIYYEGCLRGYKTEPELRSALLLMQSLFASEVSFDTDLFVPKHFKQTNGQLMGSILSFPLLCMINAAMFRQAAEEYHFQQTGQRMTLSLDYCEQTYGLRVNGDDILFIAPQGLIDIWSALVAQVGLLLSLGKNYVHPTVFTINSQMFQIKDHGLLVEYNYVNLGLIVPDESNMFSFYRTCDRTQKRLYQGITGEKLERLHEVTMYNWSPTLRRLQQKLKYNFNWYLPRHVGGLGLQSFSPIKADLFQRRIATTILTRATIKDILDNKIVYSERVIDPVLRKQLNTYKCLADKIGYKITDTVFPEVQEDPLMDSIMGKFVMDFVIYDPMAEERSFVRQAVQNLRKKDRQCGSLEPMSVEKILFSTPPQVFLEDFNFEVTEYTTSYPRCRYDEFDAYTDGFAYENHRAEAAGIWVPDDCGSDYWSALGYQRSPDNGLLTHLVCV